MFENKWKSSLTIHIFYIFTSEPTIQIFIKFGIMDLH